MTGKTLKAWGLTTLMVLSGSPLVAEADSSAMSGYLEKNDYEATCLALRDAGTIAAQALADRSRPGSEEELDAWRTGLFYAAQQTAAEVQRTEGAGDRDRAMVAALGLMAADKDLLETHLQMGKQMGVSPGVLGETLGKTCKTFQSNEYKRGLAQKMLMIYERLFAS